MNEKFKEYTDKGFEFEISSHGKQFNVSVYKFVTDKWVRGFFHEQHTRVVYEGDNLDHAFAAADLWLEGSE